MNKVITINLHGNAYQLEEGGYDALRAYLEDAARKLEGNPDKDEIIADIEQAIADKCRAVLNAYRTVVSAADVRTIIAEMGPVDGGSTAQAGDPAADRPSPTGASRAADQATDPVRHLYRIEDGALLRGVCNGLGAYFGVDVSLIRIAFVVLTLFTAGTMALVYLAMVFIIPVADTPDKKAAAFGGPSTAQEFIRRARAGYYDGMKSFNDKEARRAWKRRFRQEMRGWKYSFHQQMNAGAHYSPQSWTAHPGAYRGLWFTLSLFSLLRGALFFLLVLGIFSVVTTGALFHLTLPAGLPVWGAVLILAFAYHVIAWPLRATRHVLWHRGWNPGGPVVPGFFGFFDSLVWLAVIGGLLWLADRHVPQVHHALQDLPAFFHHTVDSIKEWWSAQKP
jgi:phage shock protein PspC (stress-responsive transcriptional regulator)